MGIGSPLDESQAVNYKQIKQIQQILRRMSRLCVTHSSARQRPRKHEQRLLHNMGVHRVVLDLLLIPNDRKKDVRMNELMRLVHELLHFRANQPTRCCVLRAAIHPQVPGHGDLGAGQRRRCRSRLLHRQRGQGDLHFGTYVESIVRSFLVDMTSCASVTHDRKHVDFALEHNVMTSAVSAFTAFSHSLGSNTAVLTRQPVFVQLLQVAFRLSQCAWLNSAQR